MNTLRKIGRSTGKFIIFLGICGLIYTIVLFFSDDWQTGIVPLIYSLSSIVLWGTVRTFSKDPIEKEEDAMIHSDFGDIAWEIASEIISESASIAIDVVSETASAAIDVVSNIDIP